MVLCILPTVERETRLAPSLLGNCIFYKSYVVNYSEIVIIVKFHSFIYF